MTTVREIIYKNIKIMGFTTPCFIRSVSEELRNELNNLGYNDLYTNTIVTQEVKTITTTTENGGWFLTGFVPDKETKYIDCGTNEELFLALASLRDDSNANQWFICKEDVWTEDYNGEITLYYEEGDWILWDYYSFMEDVPSNFRKATVEEIIEHFKR